MGGFLFGADMTKEEIIDDIHWFLEDQLYNKEETVNGVITQTNEIDPESAKDLFEFIEKKMRDYFNMS